MPPIGPSPSIDGTPMPDVVFASEAPPVAESFVSNPSRAGERDDVVGEAPGALELLHRRASRA